MMSSRWERMRWKFPTTPTLSEYQDCETFLCDSRSYLIKGRTPIMYTITTLGYPLVTTFLL